jgi:glycosyltransferase involved in cell wall biosynthesis
LKIVHLGTGFLPVSSTTSRSVEGTIYELTRYLASAGADVAIIDIRMTGGSRGDTSTKFYEVGSLPLRGLNQISYFLKVIWFSLWLFPVLCHLGRSGNVNIIHAHSQFPAAVALLARRLFRWKVPVVYTAHNPYLLPPPSLANWLKHTLIEGWVLRRVDRVMAQTEAVGRELGQRFRISAERIEQVFAGINLAAIDDFIKHHPRHENGYRTLLYPAVINPRKNQMVVIESIPDVVKAYPECRFVFAGAVDDPDYYDDIQRLVRERSLSEYVEFTGQLPMGPLYQQYQDATAFVFPTLFESQGKVLIEAMAFGLPVIASRIGPIMDVAGLEEGSAVLVDPTNTEELSSTIIRLLGDESTRVALSTRGRKLASSRFSWNRIAGDMLSVYQELTKDTKSRQPEDHPWSR